MAFKSEQLLGLCHVQGVHLIASDGYAEISALVVSHAHHRQGIGQALVAYAKNWAAEKGYPRLRLRSGLHRKHAHLFYQAIGFTQQRASYAFEVNIPAPTVLSSGETA